MTKEEIIDNIARLNSQTWRDREEVRTEIGKLLLELEKALDQPTCIGVVRFSKDDLREICNERIEIECTHGTCMDCKWWKSDDDKIIGYCHACKHGYYSDNWDISIYRKTKADFYCADFEKRGNEDGSN